MLLNKPTPIAVSRVCGSQCS